MSAKYLVAQIAFNASQTTDIGGLLVHRAVGRDGWAVTARSGFSAMGGIAFIHRKAAESYARSISRLANWRKHPLAKREAFKWAERVSAKHRAAIDRAWSRAHRLDAKLSGEAKR